VTRFRPFPKLNCQYGAPTGRRSVNLDPDTPLDRLCVAGPAGEYDAGGAYWGYGGSSGPVWAVWVRGRGHDGVCYVRARSKGAAKTAALNL
jgi:hypothetical protein